MPSASLKPHGLHVTMQLHLRAEIPTRLRKLRPLSCACMEDVLSQGAPPVNHESLTPVRLVWTRTRLCCLSALHVVADRVCVVVVCCCVYGWVWWCCITTAVLLFAYLA